MLWNPEGPYSEAKIIMNTRILDDSISRVTVEIDGNINPTTFKVVKKHKKHFKDDAIVLELLENARYEGKGWGYHVSMGFEQMGIGDDEGIMDRAQKKLQLLKDAIIRMHEFMLDYLENEE